MSEFVWKESWPLRPGRVGCAVCAPSDSLVFLISVIACGSCFMWSPESELAGEGLAQFIKLEASPGPRNGWRAPEDRPATVGQSLSFKLRKKALGYSAIPEQWFTGIHLRCSAVPPPAVLPDYPAAQDDRGKAGRELGRLASLGKIHWYEDVSTLQISVRAHRI